MCFRQLLKVLLLWLFFFPLIGDIYAFTQSFACLVSLVFRTGCQYWGVTQKSPCWGEQSTEPVGSQSVSSYRSPQDFFPAGLVTSICSCLRQARQCSLGLALTSSKGLEPPCFTDRLSEIQSSNVVVGPYLNPHQSDSKDLCSSPPD